MTELTQYVIYDHPSDYPDHFVVRPWVIKANQVFAGGLEVVTSSLELARSTVPAGYVNIGRQPNDDPAILEVWT